MDELLKEIAPVVASETQRASKPEQSNTRTQAQKPQAQKPAPQTQKPTTAQKPAATQKPAGNADPYVVEMQNMHGNNTPRRNK